MNSFNDFLLTDAEITESRLGVPRENISNHTFEGNKIDLLINGKDFFLAIYEDLEATKKGDFIWMTGWDINSNVMLVPDPNDIEKSQHSTIQKVLIRAIERGVDVLILLNKNIYTPFTAKDFAKPLNDAAGYTVCLPDERHNSYFGSVHQKSWLIKRLNETVAYVGSMDVASGRYDTKEHEHTEAWQMQPSFIQDYWGWTGGMLKIKGPAVIDIARHLYDLFSDPVPPYNGTTFTYVPEWAPPPVGVYSEQSYIQTQLTAGQKGAVNYQYYSNWAPKGEMSLLAGILKAIAAAKKYIFISDQFLWYREIMDAVSAKLDDVEAVILLTDGYNSMDHYILWFDLTITSSTKAYYQYQALSKLKDHPKVHLYKTIKELLPDELRTIIYNHWKVIMIDDEYAIIGTAGIELAAMTNDIEINLGIYNPHLVTLFRKRLWAEFLNCDENDPQLTDPIAATALWERTAAQQGRVRAYWPPDFEYHYIYRYVYDAFEPDGRLSS
ncbi:phosphatidylserine/phosphatidylglycerophosphate/cardiolipin synthase family protein [Enterobacter sp. Bisph1]|uniref:phospholipase D-like domain-containing protein n=1 Tax=Enterobacter sp. Bisph1 TaxID=1274399 RepID=UPI00057C2470|nr:phosphatidylserine/phosphatidylglycerophosphate/cardiolipin synthase family protein [Enterobacter sp. Bisph1]